MPILTHTTTLNSSPDGSDYSKMADIKDFPSLVEPREAVEVTTLSDLSQKYIKGIRTSSGQLDFTCNYDEAVYDALLAKVDTDKYFQLVFGDDSTFEWEGSFDLSLAEGSQNSPVEMIISIYPSSEITKAA